MAEETIRTSLDIPRDIHRRLRETAARRLGDNSPRIPKKRVKLEPPIVSSRGKSFNLTNEQIYELLELS